MPRPRRPALRLTADEMFELRAKIAPGAAATKQEIERARLMLRLTQVEPAQLERDSSEERKARKMLRVYDILGGDALAVVESPWLPALESVRQHKGDPFTPCPERLDQALRKSNMQAGGARATQTKRFIMLTELATSSRSVREVAAAHGWQESSLHHLLWVCKTAGEAQAVRKGYIPKPAPKAALHPQASFV